ncbi:MAG: DEAD/DEAH box helicase [Phycisphaerae bacterium]|nr:DEAD/DEAH box helicase [Gemmatimonadaceae bacterium]
MTHIKVTDQSWRRATLPDVCRRIGVAALRGDAGATAADALKRDGDDGTHAPQAEPPDAHTLGDITLRPHQLDAQRRLEVSIRARGGALLADTVGLGKTYVALAVAREYAEVHVLAPAALVPMWRKAVLAARASGVTLHSLHRFSRQRASLSGSRKIAAQRALIIIDEAHYLRTRTTVRYGNVALFCANCDVVLISATPLHNRPRELRNILALFLGERSDALDAQTLAQCVVRRSTANVGVSLPAVAEHRAVVIPDNPAVLECILTVASPLPPHNGSAASALVRLGLLRAWCSSDAALTDAIRRRQLRGEALLHSLTHGRYPTQRELQSWIVGTDSVQLGFPDLLVDTATTECAPLLKTLLAHLDSLQALLERHFRSARADQVRIAYLRQLLGEQPSADTPTQVFDAARADIAPNPPIVAFSQFASTVRALHRALGDIAGIASLTSHGGRITSGKVSREELIAQFAPRSNGRPPPPERERIRLLLTTDLLAEGVNLQDANTIIHLDLPWTDALRKQRVGRLVRMGSQHTVVHVHTFAPPMGTERALRVLCTLERKAGLHREWVGNEVHTPQAINSPSVAEAATQLRELWQLWAGPSAIPHSTGTEDNHAWVAVANADETGFLAVIVIGSSVSVLACAGTTSAPSSDVHGVLKSVRATCAQRPLSPSPVPELRVPDEFVNCRLSRAMAQIQQWVADHSLRAMAGESSRELAPSQQRGLQQLSAVLNSVPAIARRSLRADFAHAEQQVLHARGAGAEMALRDWLETHTITPVSDWLARVPHSYVNNLHVLDDAAVSAEEPCRVLAVVLLVARGETEGRMLV